MSDEQTRLSGKTALVTGAARRIGRAVALALARNGADVVVHYNTSASQAKELARHIGQLGRRAWTIQADLARPEEAEGLISRAVEQAGPLHILINNAAIFPAGRLADLRPEELLESININALAPLLAGRAFAAQGRGGAIVNLLDSRITDYDRTHAAYHLTRRMLLSLTRMMALEFAPAVRVNAVAPGAILPPPGREDENTAAAAAGNLLGRCGTPEEVADAVLFLLTNEFVVGQVIYVDGGRHMRGRTYD